MHAERPSDDALDHLLGGLAPVDTIDDAVWAKRVGAMAARGRRSLAPGADEVLTAPFSDDHDDHDGLDHEAAADGVRVSGDFDHPRFARDDHWRGTDSHDHGDGHSAAADEHGAAAPWEASMSDDPHGLYDDDRASGPSPLGGLGRLARTSVASSRPAPLEGEAKGEDSGLIDLKAMTEPEAPVATLTAAPAPAPASQPQVAPSAGGMRASGARTVPEIPAARIPESKAPPASRPSGAVPAAPVAVSAAPIAEAPASAVAPIAQPAAPAQTRGKESRGAGLWIGLGGLAAAAVVGVFVVATMNGRKSGGEVVPTHANAKDVAAPSASTPASASAAAVAPTASASSESAWTGAAPEPSASAAPDPSANLVASNDSASKLAKVGVKAGASAPAAMPDKDDKPTPPTPAASAADAPKKPGGGAGSLDEALGLGKDDPNAKTKAAAKSDLPEKPESMDVRTAVSSKLAAARACVKGLDGDSKVTIAFGPGGGVSNVSVTAGPAKGGGAEGCIKSAFSSAKVPPSQRGGQGYATLSP
jgi:hypothetical protein